MKSIIKKIVTHRQADNVLLISLISVLLLIFIIPTVFATPEEKRIEQIDIQKIQVNKDIKDNENDIAAAKINLKQVKKAASTSWDAVLEIREAENKILQAQANYTASRNELKSLLQEKSDLIKIIRGLVKVEVEDDTPLIPSNLTKRIGITLSNSCIIMVSNNFTTNCPSYEDLFILDSSNTSWSGNFTTDYNGFFHREDPPIDNSYRLYQFDSKVRIFIDPPHPDRYKLITIVPNFDTYFIAGDLIQRQEYTLINVTQAGNSTQKAINYSYLNQTQEYGRVLYHDRYVDNCKSSVIDAEDWEILLVDTINFLRNDCLPQHTSFDEREVIIPEYDEIDITTSPNYQAKWQLEEDMIRCKVLC